MEQKNIFGFRKDEVIRKKDLAQYNKGNLMIGLIKEMLHKHPP